MYNTNIKPKIHSFQYIIVISKYISTSLNEVHKHFVHFEMTVSTFQFISTYSISKTQNISSIHNYHNFHHQSCISFNTHIKSYSIDSVTQFHTFQRQFSSISIKPEKILKVITNYFWFPIETNNNQTFILMYEQYPRTCDVHLTSTPYLSSWLRWLEITEQYNSKLFIDFNKYLMVLGSNRYPTHRQLTL